MWYGILRFDCLIVWRLGGALMYNGCKRDKAIRHRRVCHERFAADAASHLSTSASPPGGGGKTKSGRLLVEANDRCRQGRQAAQAGPCCCVSGVHRQASPADCGMMKDTNLVKAKRVFDDHGTWASMQELRG